MTGGIAKEEMSLKRRDTRPPSGRPTSSVMSLLFGYLTSAVSAEILYRRCYDIAAAMACTGVVVVQIAIFTFHWHPPLQGELLFALLAGLGTPEQLIPIIPEPAAALVLVVAVVWRADSLRVAVGAALFHIGTRIGVGIVTVVLTLKRNPVFTAILMIVGLAAGGIAIRSVERGLQRRNLAKAQELAFLSQVEADVFGSPLHWRPEAANVSALADAYNQVEGSLPGPTGDMRALHDLVAPWVGCSVSGSRAPPHCDAVIADLPQRAPAPNTTMARARTLSHIVKTRIGLAMAGDDCQGAALLNDASLHAAAAQGLLASLPDEVAGDYRTAIANASAAVEVCQATLALDSGTSHVDSALCRSDIGCLKGAMDTFAARNIATGSCDFVSLRRTNNKVDLLVRIATRSRRIARLPALFEPLDRFVSQPESLAAELDAAANELALCAAVPEAYGAVLTTLSQARAAISLLGLASSGVSLRDCKLAGQFMRQAYAFDRGQYPWDFRAYCGCVEGGVFVSDFVAPLIEDLSGVAAPDAAAVLAQTLQQCGP